MERQHQQQNTPHQHLASLPEATAALNTLKPFICPNQMAAIEEAIAGEEGEYFVALIVQLAVTIATMPRTYETEGLGLDAVAHLHYFKGGCDWFISELDILEEQSQTFGLADMGFPELGYISLPELLENNAEIDLHWQPVAISAIR
jgi:hypothetical protein